MDSAQAPDGDAAAGLVARIRSGDRGAEEELVRRYSRGVSVVLKRATGDAALVDDLYQETFRLVLCKIREGSLRDPARLSGFIVSVARNLAIEHFRRGGREAKTEDLERLEGRTDPAPGPLERLVQREQADLARRVLAELGSERDRQALYRFYVAEDDKESICADLGLDRLQFNRVLFRARQRYRELYEQAIRRK